MNLQQAQRWFFYADWTMLAFGALALFLSLGLSVYALFPRNKGRRKAVFLRACVCFVTFALTLAIQASVTIAWFNQQWTPLRTILFAAPVIPLLFGLLGSIYCGTRAFVQLGRKPRRQTVFRALLGFCLCGIGVAPHAITLLIPLITVEDRGNRPGTLAQIGEPLPDFELTTLDGLPFRTSDSRGRVIVLNFFATWCGPCQMELPHLQAIWDEFQSHENFQMLVIGREESDEILHAFLRKNNLTFPVAADPDALVYGQFASQSIPRTFLVSADGTIVYEWTGTHEDEIFRLKRLLRQELKWARTNQTMHPSREVRRLAN
jgi:peroxiredoxin